MYNDSNGGTNPGTTPSPPPGVTPPPNQYPAPLPPVPGPGGKPNALTIDYWLKQHWKLLLLIVLALIVLGQTIFQIVYPSSRLIPGTVVDGLPLGGMKYEEAAKELDDAYGDLELKIYFGKNEAAFQSPKMSEVGIGVDNQTRLEAITYPVYLRFIPGSIFWAPALSQPGDIEYEYDKNKIASYTTSKVGEDCSIPPQNATLKLIDSQLQLVPSIVGGKCDINELQQALAEVRPNSDQNSPDNSIRVSIDETPAPITDDMARDLAAKLNSRMSQPMPITVDKETDTIPGRVVLSWLDFVADVPEDRIDNSGNESARLLFDVNEKRMEDYLNQGIAAKLIKKPGVSKVTTRDFKEISRVNGANGRAVDITRVAKSVEDYIDGKTDKAVGATKVVGPTTDYTRHYTPTSVGFAALLAQFDEDHPGTYAMAFTELSGVRHPRSATYRGDARMPAAGIDSIFLAYTDIMEEYAGKARPVDIISDGKKASECFKDMLQKFDRGCRVGFYDYFGHATLTARANELGLKNTVFAGEDTVTSANDIQKLLVGLYKNSIARIEGGQEILSAMRASWNNDGISAATGTSEVSHVIGEGEGMHNDAGIVYSNSYGAYALTVLSEGASWDHIKELSQKILALKAVKIPPDAR